jgi:hypothetical protein
MKIKDVIVAYCRACGCPVQKTMDAHRENLGSEDEIKLIKYSHCVRCDIWKLRKWLESHNLRIELGDGDDENPLHYF